MKPAVIFDIDGTLCDVSPLRYLVARSLKNRNFDEFHRRSIDMMPIEWVAQESRNIAASNVEIIMVTARQEQYRSLTSYWLAMHDIPSDELWMRPANDYRPDYEIKKEILRKLEQKYNVLHAYDDNPAIIKLWAEEKIPYTTVPGWSDE